MLDSWTWHMVLQTISAIIKKKMVSDEGTGKNKYKRANVANDLHQSRKPLPESTGNSS